MLATKKGVCECKHVHLRCARSFWNFFGIVFVIFFGFQKIPKKNSKKIQKKIPKHSKKFQKKFQKIPKNSESVLHCVHVSLYGDGEVQYG